MMLHDFQADCAIRLRQQNLPFEPNALRAFCTAVWPAAEETGDTPDFWTAEFLQTMPAPAPVPACQGETLPPLDSPPSDLSQFEFAI